MSKIFYFIWLKFHDKQFEEAKFSLTILKTRLSVFFQLLLNWLSLRLLLTVLVFLHRAWWELCSQSQIKHVSVPKLLSPWKISCAFIELWMHLRSLERTQEVIELLSAIPSSNSYTSFPLSKLPATLSMNQFFRKRKLLILTGDGHSWSYWCRITWKMFKKICALLTYTLHNILIINYIATTAKLCWMTFWKRNRICAFQPRKGVKPDWY